MRGSVTRLLTRLHDCWRNLASSTGNQELEPPLDQAHVDTQARDHFDPRRPKKPTGQQHGSTTSDSSNPASEQLLWSAGHQSFRGGAAFAYRRFGQPRGEVSAVHGVTTTNAVP